MQNEKTVVSIHQPDFLPWLGFFYKMKQSDIFVFLDHVQFVKNGYRNRVTIKTPQGVQWLTVPVQHHFGQTINETAIDNRRDWRKKHLKTLEMNYKKAPFFKEIMDILEPVYLERQWLFLSEFTLRLIEAISVFIGIKVKTFTSSTMDVTGSSTDLLVDIIEKCDGAVYISGTGGKNYLQENTFEDRGITLVYSDFEHPVYSQLWGDFIQGTSIVDMLFNCGRKTMQYL